MEDDDDGFPVSLDRERARRFLNLLADEPFLALVVTEQGEVRIFSKGIEGVHIDRIRELLVQVMEAQ